MPNAALTGAEGVRVEGTVMQRVPCPAIVGSERIGGTDDQPLMSVYFCQFDEGHDGEHSSGHNV